MKHSIIFAILLSLLTGFCSLSMEILWIRVFSFSLYTLPQAFSYVLMIFLLGIAAGALVGKNFCTNTKYDLYSVSAIALTASAMIDLVSLKIVGVSSYPITVMTVLIFTTAFLKSIVFPIAHHLVSNSRKMVGSSVSYVYFGNIIGSTLGPLVTGFFLLEYFTVLQAFHVVALITFSSAFYAMLLAKKRRLIIINATMTLSAVGLGIMLLVPTQDIWSHLIEITKKRNISFIQTIENRYGVINVERQELMKDTVFGFGMYDGKMNTNIHNDQNNIQRAYRAAGFHDKPEKVLMIGLSTGSWAKVISRIEGIKSFEIVEINPGYIDLIKEYAEHATLLDDPIVKIYFDDGRRWLNRNPDKKFDLIVMNTSFHFRNNMTNLLSREFLQIVKSRLNEGGIFYYNTTGSPDVFKTAKSVFKNAFLYMNFVVCSDGEISLPRERAFTKIASMSDENKPVFDLTRIEDVRVIEKILDEPLVPYEVYVKNLNRDVKIISDDFPVTEYSEGKFLEMLRIKLNKVLPLLPTE